MRARITLEERRERPWSCWSSFAISLSVLVFTGFFWTVTAVAANIIPSCYQLVDIDRISPPIERGLLVVVDNTIELEHALQRESFEKIVHFMSEGDRVVIISFSAYVEDQYTRIRADARLDRMLSKDAAFTVPKQKLKELKRCLAGQKRSLARIVGTSLEAIYAESSTDLPNTELLATLAKTSREILPILKARETYLLIVSDMMEHSDVTSFYKSGNIRMIDPEAELQKAEASGVVAVYPGTVAYIIGAGYTGAGKYRSAKVMRAVEDFWRLYIARAGGRLQTFGTPSMFGDIAR